MEPPDLEAVFNEALDQEPGPQRSAYLDGACRGHPGLRARVEELLRQHDRAGLVATTPGARPSDGSEPPLDTEVGSSAGNPPAPEPESIATTPGMALAEPVSTIDQPARRGTERPGDRIGPYKLLEPIGEGGMGTVFMAEQTEPVKRLVALKVIKAGMDSRQVLARFDAERQALALMDHPNIARVLDAGTTGSGRPYFVMELVKGVPITRFCDQRRLTPRERLELFIPVCQAVQHAHQKGVIHRDLKPSNVLIALYDGKPVPKVIDFGVAKATGPRLTDRTLYTEFGTIVGTLEYMSPEQAELNQLDVDTRSDIYSLGVLLYELLTGTTPLERKRLDRQALLEALRLIREEEPPRPSTRLSTTEKLPSIAASRGVEPRRLSGLLRGDLDWIVMKCLEKDRDRRYETANGLARDIERHLHDELVSAGPPSAGYRLRKLARRNRTALLTAAAVASALVIATAVSTWQAVRATRAEGLAEARLSAERKALREVSQQRDRADLARKEADRNFASFRVASLEHWIRDGQALREHRQFDYARVHLDRALTEALELRAKFPEPNEGVEVPRGIAQFLLGRWPGLAPGVSPAERPAPSFVIEAPLRAEGPVADGQIAPGEYGPGIDATFNDDANPGRLYAWGATRPKTLDDLSVRVHAAHTDRSLFLAFRVRDQVIEVTGPEPHLHDDVEVFINGDQVANDKSFANNMVPNGNREGFQLVADAAGHQFTTTDSFTNADWKVGTSRTADGYIIEFEIPLGLIDTQDGPEFVPAASGSELLVNFGFKDIDGPLSAAPPITLAYGIFWAEDPALSPYFGGEDFWTVALRLVPKPVDVPPPAHGP